MIMIIIMMMMMMIQLLSGWVRIGDDNDNYNDDNEDEVSIVGCAGIGDRKCGSWPRSPRPACRSHSQAQAKVYKSIYINIYIHKQAATWLLRGALLLKM